MTRFVGFAPHGRFDDEALTLVVEGSEVVVAAMAGHKIVHLRLPLADFKRGVEQLDAAAGAQRPTGMYVLLEPAATPEPPDETQPAPPAAPVVAPTAARVSSGMHVHVVPGPTGPSPAQVAAQLVARRSIILGGN